MSQCRLCRSENLHSILDVGNLPIAHEFSADKSTAAARSCYPMHLLVCGTCGLGQLEESIPSEVLYSDYNFCFSSWKAQPHIIDECELIRELKPAGTILEVGSNDGLFLSTVKEYGDYKCIGIEPNPVTNDEAKAKGLNIINKFFEDASREDLDDTTIDVIVARQVLEHIQDVGNFLSSSNKLLGEGGLICLEVPNTDIALKTGDISCLWEEHVNYFTPASLSDALRGYGFEVQITKTYHFSGEALLIVAKKITHKDEFEIPTSIDISLFLGYKDKVEAYRVQLLETLQEYKAKGYQIVLYGSGCRASTAIHGLGLLGSIDLLVDDQKEKQGMFMPGTGLQVQSRDAFDDDEKYFVLLAVNNENDEKVVSNIKGSTSATFDYASMHSPKQIIAELLEPHNGLG